MARAFDRTSSQYLEVSSAPVSTGPLTIAAWCYATEGANFKDVVCIGDWSRNHYYILRLSLGENVRAQVAGSASGIAQTSANFSLNTWFHACAVFASASDIRAYLDGGNEAQDTTAGTASELDTISIGCWSYNATRGYYMDGYIAEPVVWNVAFTAADVAVLATGISPLSFKPESLVFHCPLVRDNDEDIVGGLSLTASGSPTIAVHPPVIYPAPPIFYMKAEAEEDERLAPKILQPKRNIQLPIRQLNL